MLLNRKQLFEKAVVVLATVGLVYSPPQGANAFQIHSTHVLAAPPTVAPSSSVEDAVPATLNVAYKPLSISGDLGVDVPVACWFPVGQQQQKGQQKSEDVNITPAFSKLRSYNHRISVRRIGQLLGGMNFIPEFVARDFALQPSSPSVADGQELDLPEQGPVVLLAHGYLGSRFDLSHLAENLASQGFICFAAEYPESLAASFDRIDGLDRKAITSTMIDYIENDWNVKATSYGIVGHSMGCGTALETGDDSWTRVAIAGFPRKRDGTPITGDLLLLSSMNDGAVSLARIGGKEAIPSDFTILDEDKLRNQMNSLLPNRAALVFDRPDAPNHISFLAESVGNAMIDLLSPLLPVAQALKVPVLDFDRYKASQDSQATADVVHPVVIAYMKQRMMHSRN